MKKSLTAIIFIIAMLSIYSIAFADKSTENTKAEPVTAKSNEPPKITNIEPVTAKAEVTKAAPEKVKKQKWEYKCVLSKFDEKALEKTANKMGQKRWEMISFTFQGQRFSSNYISCYKRPILR